MYWRTHDASPGEPVAWADLQALELYQQIQRQGWPMVSSLRTLRLSEQEAGALFLRLEWLTEHLPQMLAAWKGTSTEAGTPPPAQAARQNGWG